MQLGATFGGDGSSVPGAWILEGSGEIEKAECFLGDRMTLALGVDDVDWGNDHSRDKLHNAVQT